MTKKERAKLRRQRKIRRIVLTISMMALVAAIAIGGTLAWLTDKTAAVVNTFTVGNINIELDESDNLDLKMVPGKKITKNPVATVKANSEACWLFVKVEESDNLEDFISYTINSAWAALDGAAGVYYRVVAADDEDQEFPVLDDDKVTVLNDVTKTMMDGLTPDTYPTLTFTAYACQQAGRTVDEAAVELRLKTPAEPAPGT